jgi:EAL domain-containing protein (putative c-di-GMP-specific phosphodiesterase class I)
MDTSSFITPALLQECLETKQAVVRLQPIFPLQGGKPKKHETLLRLLDKRSDEILPKNFIPVAVACGMMPKLDMLVLEQLLSQLELHKMAPPSKIAINLSRRTLHNESYCKRLMEDDWRRLLSHIVFEVKTADLAKDGLAFQILKSFKADGAQLSVDYVGGGARMAEVTAKLGFDYLKMDMPRTLSGREPLATVQEACRAASANGATVVFERVETKREMDVVHQMEADLAQGNLLGTPQFKYTDKPLPREFVMKPKGDLPPGFVGA